MSVRNAVLMLEKLANQLKDQKLPGPMTDANGLTAIDRVISVMIELRGCFSNYDDVVKFHEKFHVGPPEALLAMPFLPAPDVFEFRMKFFQEELMEIEDAYHTRDLVKYFDGHLDLAYITFGSSHLANLPWQLGWERVQRANMDKIRAKSAAESAEATGRGHKLDVIKPTGWKPPEASISAILDAKLAGSSDDAARKVGALVPVGLEDA